MQAMCRVGDALFVLDEVQTGVGITGTAWAYQQLGLEPDIVAFAKKVQLGGIMAGRRVDEVVDNVFAVPGRMSGKGATHLLCSPGDGCPFRLTSLRCRHFRCLQAAAPSTGPSITLHNTAFCAHSGPHDSREIEGGICR